MSIGMTADEFWNGDNALPKAYRDADRLNRIRKNNEDYRLGAYIYNALAAVSPLFRFSMSRSIKAEPYLAQPFPVDEEDVERREESKQEKEMQRLLARLKADVQKAKKEAVNKDGRERAD